MWAILSKHYWLSLPSCLLTFKKYHRCLKYRTGYTEEQRLSLMRNPSCKANRNTPAEVNAKVKIPKPVKTSTLTRWGQHIQKIIWLHCSLSLFLVPKSIRGQPVGLWRNTGIQCLASSQLQGWELTPGSWVPSMFHGSPVLYSGVQRTFNSKPHPEKYTVTLPRSPLELDLWGKDDS